MEQEVRDHKPNNVYCGEEEDKDPVLLSALPSDTDRFLNKLKEEYITDSMKVLTEAAKQVVTVIPIIISIFTFVVGYFKGQNLSIDLMRYQHPIAAIFLSLLLSLVSAMISIIPAKVHLNIFEIGNIEQVTNKRIRRKHRWVVISYIFLVGSLLSLSLFYLFMLTGVSANRGT